MTDTPERFDEDDALIGEYVLGLLSGEEAAEVDRRLPQEPALAASFRDWNEMLAPLLAGRDVAPPARLKTQIEARLFPQARRRGWLRWGALIGGPALAFAAAFLLLDPVPSFDPSLHVDLIAPDIGLSIAAGADEDTLRIIHQSGTPPPGRDYELWLVAGDAAPVSLGVLPVSGSIDIPRPDGLATGVVFAITEELEGGSPTGAPTGPILIAEPLFDI